VVQPGFRFGVSIEGENVVKICKAAIALMVAICGYVSIAAATPLEDCASSS